MIHSVISIMDIDRSLNFCINHKNWREEQNMRETKQMDVICILVPFFNGNPSIPTITFVQD